MFSMYLSHSATLERLGLARLSSSQFQNFAEAGDDLLLRHPLG